MQRFIFFLIFILCFLYINIAYALQSDWGGLQEAKVRIISPLSNNFNNDNIYLGLEYHLEEGWKTYWHSPGDGGYPQTLSWKDSINVSSIEILWPEPKEIETLGLKSIGYEDEIIFPLQVELEDIYRDSFFSFDLNYLVCKDICIPGKVHLELTLPAGQGQYTNHLFQIEKYLSKIPFKQEEIVEYNIKNVTASSNQNSSFIFIEAQSKFSLLKPKFFLGNDQGLPIVSPQYIFSADRKNVKVKFFYDDFIFNNKNFDLSILFSDRNIAIEYFTKIKITNVSNFLEANHTYIHIFLIAMLGGLILNVMPCVFPILSLKLLTILNYNQRNLFYSIRKSFFVTASGIIVSFVILSFLLIGLRMSGSSISWGMQFQQPLFLMTIALVLFLFSLNLTGFFVFRLPHFINNLLSISNNNKSFYTDFFNGFFATLLATPCSAPFVGTAISAAFTQSSFMMIGIFFFMGLGMGVPYIIAGIFPSIVKLLPKPGAWMHFVKIILAILLLGTIIWLGSILQNYFNSFFIIISSVLALIILLSFKYLNQLKFLAIALSITIFFSLIFFPQLKIDKLVNDTHWLDLTKVNIEELINDNIIFVDITADWCATCQFNKFNVLNSKVIKDAFLKNNIIKIRGNWTKPNKQIEQYLYSYNRFGVPFNIMYDKHNPQGIIFSELLTISEMLNAIDLIKKNNE